MLLCYISKLDGTERTIVSLRAPAPETGTAAQVAVPLNDSRTASCNVSMYDRAAMAALGPAIERLLWVYYKPTHLHAARLVFLGPIHQPIWSFGQGLVTLNAHDPSFWAKKAYHRYGDIVVDKGYTVDGRGMRDLWTSVVPSEEQIARGVKHPGVLWGYDDTVRLPKPDKYLVDPPPVGKALTAIVTRGTQVYQSMQDLASVAGLETGVGGPDWDLKPLDTRDKGTYYSNTSHTRVERDSRPAQIGTNIWYAQLDTFKSATGKGSDLTKETQFQYGYGLDNLVDLQVTGEGDREANYAVVVGPGGEDSKRDTKHRALRHNEAAWLRHGIVQTWEASGSEDPLNVLQLKAQSFVEAYGWAPVFVAAVLQPDAFHDPADGPRKYAFFDFEHGDRIRVGAKRGHAKFFVAGQATNAADGRITQLQLADDVNGMTQQVVEIVPTTAVDIGSLDEGG